jgi:uncharacterized protein
MYVVNDCPEKGEDLLLNTMTGTIMKLPHRTFAKIEKSPDDAMNSALGVQLRNKGFLLDDDLDDETVFLHFLRGYAYGSGHAVITVFTTWECNCRCAYCYEEGHRPFHERLSMDSQTQDDVCDWIRRYVARSEPHSVDLCFHGGEPLCNVEAIEKIAQTLSNVSANGGIALFQSAVTNGSLLSKEVAERIHNAGVRALQITLDGTQKVHDLRRPFASGDGTYDVIVSNLIASAGLFDVAINIIADRNNIQHIPELLDALAAEPLRSMISHVNISPLSAPDCQSAWFDEHSLPQKEYAEAVVRLMKEVVRRGLRVRQLLSPGVCMVLQDRNALITPDGHITKCVQCAGAADDPFRVASVRDDIDVFLMRAARFVAHCEASCRGCTWRPFCTPGCWYDRIKGRGWKCHRAWHAAYVPGILRLAAENDLSPQGMNARQMAWAEAGSQGHQRRCEDTL